MRAAEIAREEMQSKIKMVLEANDQPMTVKQIREHPTMAGTTGQKIAQIMRHMTGIRMGKGKRWSTTGAKTKVARPKRVSKKGSKRGPYKKNGGGEAVMVAVEQESLLKGVRFRITREGQLMLIANEICLPVEFE